MNKTCARCEKTVYPTEELKCLDKTWHKGCFKCQECGMTLNMRTYKGYGKLPYCEAHVPKAKPTTMAETPELKRIAENTKLQSNVTYHAAFEKSKGKFTQVADDPETLRIKANTKIISNVAYHGDLEKKAQMEKQRQINENGEIVEVASDSYHQQIESYATEMLPPAVPPPNLPQKNHYQNPMQYQAQNNRPAKHYTPEPQNYPPEPQNYTPEPQHYPPEPQHYSPEPQHYPAEPQKQYYRQPQPKHEEYRAGYQKYDEYDENYQYGQQQQPQYRQNQQPNYGGAATQQKIGRIQDYDPVTDGPRVLPNMQRTCTTVVYNSTTDGRQKGAHQTQQQQQQQSRQIGRVADLDPLANELPRAPPNHHNQQVYIAIYDYEANDSDEVSFREGDLISNVSSIDSGWMTGQVLRTGRTGMLPANYVEAAPAGAPYNN